MRLKIALKNWKDCLESIGNREKKISQGFTIRGDGQVVMVLNPKQILSYD